MSSGIEDIGFNATSQEKFSFDEYFALSDEQKIKKIIEYINEEIETAVDNSFEYQVREKLEKIDILIEAMSNLAKVDDSIKDDIRFTMKILDEIIEAKPTNTNTANQKPVSNEKKIDLKNYISKKIFYIALFFVFGGSIMINSAILHFAYPKINENYQLQDKVLVEKGKYTCTIHNEQYQISIDNDKEYVKISKHQFQISIDNKDYLCDL